MSIDDLRGLSRVQHNLLPSYIEIETSTYCNRRCSWCPNSLFSRGEEQRYMERRLLDKILLDLGALNFSGEIALHNYNEPLADPHLFSHLANISHYVPKSRKLILTNGDLLDAKMLDRLRDAKVDLVRVTLYSAMGLANPDGLVRQLRPRLDIMDCVRNDDIFGVKYDSWCGGMKIQWYVPDRKYFTSRGGILTSPSKESPACYLPFISAAIDVDGHLKICCEVYPAEPRHAAEGFVGNLWSNSFAELWFSKEMNVLRKGLLEQRKENVVCKSCSAPPKSSFKITKDKLASWKGYLKGGEKI